MEDDCMTYMERYEQWMTGDAFDADTKAELAAIAGNEKEIEDRFYRELEFGTGGLRGVLGAGTNRLNVYTIRKATQGLANYINKLGIEGTKKSVTIAYDSRRMSPEFSDEAALVLAANGIKGYVFDALRPVPILSFALRQLGATAGIVITASHNPPEYNGYKVYWDDGAQVTSPKDEEIIQEVNEVTDYAQVKTITKEEAIKNGLYEVISPKMDDDYIDALKALVIDKDVIEQESDNLCIVYSPLHGSGNIPVRRVLKELGFHNVHIVKEQELPDGTFPTVSYPNPEDINAFELAIKLGKEVNADVIMATDPDADRLGVLAKDAQGEYRALNGNNIGILLMDYILTRKQELGILPENGAVVGTIVSTDMAKAVCQAYEVELFETLTGFKYIGEKIKEFEETGSHTFLFGYEESYGCLIGTHARDKDAVVAVMGVAELSAYYKSKDMTLYDALEVAYEKYGYYKETLQSITLKGVEGVAKIQHILTSLRKQPPTKMGDALVVEAKDFENGEVLEVATGMKRSTGLPSSNVLYYQLEENAWFCVRPSGTEPKVKFYFGVRGTSVEDANRRSLELETAVMNEIKKSIDE